MYAHEIIGIRRLVVGGWKSFEIKYVLKNLRNVTFQRNLWTIFAQVNFIS